MKLKIAKEFKDKYTGERYIPGDVKEFEDERAKEILSDPRKLVAKVQEKKSKR